MYVYGCFVSVYFCVPAEEGVGNPGTGVMGGRELSCGYWELLQIPFKLFLNPCLTPAGVLCRYVTKNSRISSIQFAHSLLNQYKHAFLVFYKADLLSI